MNYFKGMLYAILSSVAFGVMPILAKIAYAYGSNPTTVLISRFLLASLLLFILLIFQKSCLKVSFKQLGLLLSIGIVGYTLTTQTLFVAYNYLGAGLATTLHFIYPAIVCVFSFIFVKEKITPHKILSLLLAAMGVFMLIADENTHLNSFGIFLALFSGISYGLTILGLGHKMISSLDHKVCTMYVCLGAALGTIGYGLCTHTIVLTLSFNLLLAYLAITVISTILSMILLLKAIERIGTSSASILGTFEPIVSIILGILLFGENLTFSLILGTCCILISTLVLAKAPEV